jgi:outer membrane immunogenic protein
LQSGDSIRHGISLDLPIAILRNALAEVILMKKLFFAASILATSSLSAWAADMPVKAPIASPYNWTGFYLGANVGGGWGNRNVNFSANDPAAAAVFDPAVGGAPPSTSFKSSGALGGLQFGYNWQFNRNWLVGMETDFDWSGVKGSGSSTGAFQGAVPFTATEDERIKWFGTVRARLGYLPMDTVLTYITGGFAYGRVDRSGSYVNNSTLAGFASGPVGGSGVACAATATCFSGSSSSVNTGWTVGAGFEYAILKNITLKAEYMYVSLGNKSLTETALVTGGGGVAPASFNVNYGNSNFNVARVGLNYRF